MEKVCVKKCGSYEEGEVLDALRSGIDKIGYVLPTGKNVLIKPNIMSQNKPEQHTITHYSIVEALCKILKEDGNEIYIGDSIAFYQKGLSGRAFKTSRMKEAADKYGAHLVEFEKEKLVRIEEGVEGLEALYLPKILFEMDLIIDACKLKTHGGMRLSGAIKNMFGCLPGGYKQKIHRWTGDEFRLSDVFIDIHKVLKPGFCVMDGVKSLDGGPTALGKPVDTGVILIGENPAAVDIAAARMIGYAPEDIPMLLQAVRRGMIKDLKDVDILGELPTFKFRKLVQKDLHRKFNTNGIFVKDTYVNLKIDQKTCKECLDCIQECPVGAIRRVDGVMTLDQDRCISCYHCLFACPKGVVGIDPTFMNRLVRAVRKIAGL